MENRSIVTKDKINEMVMIEAKELLRKGPAARRMFGEFDLSAGRGEPHLCVIRPNDCFTVLALQEVKELDNGVLAWVCVFALRHSTIKVPPGALLIHFAADDGRVVGGEF